MLNVTRNVGTVDRVLRSGISMAMLYFGFMENALVTDPVARGILAVMGVFFFVVVLLGHCPLYVLVGINTCGSPSAASGTD